MPASNVTLAAVETPATTKIPATEGNTTTERTGQQKECPGIRMRVSRSTDSISSRDNSSSRDDGNIRDVGSSGRVQNSSHNAQHGQI